MAGDVLRADRIGVTIGGIRILKDVSLTVAPGESVALIGESGSGKSMFVRTVLGLLPSVAKVSGTLEFEGSQLIGRPDRDYRALRGSRIGYIPQDPAAAFNPTIRVAAQIREPVEFHPARAAEVRPAPPVELLRQVGLTEPERRVHQYPHEMSGGMLQRALIAAAVSLGPSLLLADEPTTGLDVTTQAGIVELIQALQARSGMALLLISHDLALVSTICSRIVVLYRGEVVESGSTAKIVGNPSHPYTQALVAATPTLEREPA